MLHALTHDKLRPEAERAEDVLTGAVLGAASCLPTASCWTSVLRAGRAQQPGEQLPVPAADDSVAATLWPKWPHGDGRSTEPDVVLRWPGAIDLAVPLLSRTGAEDLVTRVVAPMLQLVERSASV